MRSIALDVHRSFCEVAIKDGTKLRSGGRIKTSVAELELFAKSLAADDQVTLEASGPALAIKRILEPHVGRVVIANTRKVRAIAEAKVKTDQVDFLDAEVGLIERELAAQALASQEIRRLMTVPGVSLISAATFAAVVGDITRFPTQKKLVSYLGLDPKVRQSGETPARHGRIS